LVVDPQNSAELAAGLMELSDNFSLRQQLATSVQAMDFGDQSWLFIGKKTVEAYENVIISTPRETRMP
jgi:hypothetical protein